MCRLKLTFIVLCIITIASASSAQNFYAYTESGQARDLILQDSLITVKLAGGLQFWLSIYSAEGAINSSIPPQRIADGFDLLRVSAGNDPVALVERLRERDDVLFANCAFQDPSGNPIFLTETFVANFHPTVAQAHIDSMIAAHGVEVVDSLFNDPYWLLLRLTADSDLDVLAMGNHYHESSLVRYAKASMVLKFEFFSEPNDEYWDYQWNFRNTGQTGGTPDADIDLDEAYEFFQSPSTFVTVAILDDGFAVHEDCPSNTLIGGWDYVLDGPDYSPDDNMAHGMSCMGLIASTTNNEIGIAGVARNARILGFRIGGIEGFASDDNLGRAFGDAIVSGARVISNSWGCWNCAYFFPTTPYWIRKADSAGAVVVFASGNGGAIAWPAYLPEVFTVGATDEDDLRWSYSSFGPELDVVAPSGDVGFSGNIWTLDQMGAAGYNPLSVTCEPYDVDYMCKFGGTSAACPTVAGIIARLLARRTDLIGQSQIVKDVIKFSSEDKGTPGRDDLYGWGRVNAARALIAVTRGDANNSGSISIDDAVHLINYIAGGGPAPVPNLLTGDADCNGAISIADAVYIINYIYSGGQAPQVCFTY